MGAPYQRVERILDELRITGPADLQLLDLIAHQRGAVVREALLQGAEARLSVLGRRAVITVATSVRDTRRRRFSIAHELGHLEMHRRQREVFLCTSQDINDAVAERPAETQEQEANEFAAELLLPERFFAHLCDEENPSLDYIAELATRFNVSLTATALRYLEFSCEACAIVFSRDGYIRWFRRSKEFEDSELFIEIKCRPDPSTVASAVLASGVSPRMQKRVSVSAWCAPGSYRQDATLAEQSWAIPSDNAALTLLWVDDDIEDDDSW